MNLHPFKKGDIIDIFMNISIHTPLNLYDK